MCHLLLGARSDRRRPRDEDCVTPHSRLPIRPERRIVDPDFTLHGIQYQKVTVVSISTEHDYVCARFTAPKPDDDRVTSVQVRPNLFE